MTEEEFGRLKSIIVSVGTNNGTVHVTMTHKPTGHSEHGSAPAGIGADAAARAVARRLMIEYLDRRGKIAAVPARG